VNLQIADLFCGAGGTSTGIGLARIKDIQARAGVDLINADEEARILELIEAQTWPRGWDGTEPMASDIFDNVNPDGSVQPIMRELMI